MQITLINCNPRLASLGIDMEVIGAFDALCALVIAKVPYISVEYQFSPIDKILITIDDGIEPPNDLSMFGEVV